MEDALKLSSFSALMAVVFLSTSCSWYRNMERSLIDEDKKEAKSQKNRNHPVPREQYDELLAKYEDLSKKYETLKEGKPTEQTSLVDEINKSQSENFATPSPNVETETVDVFPPAGQQVVASTSPAVPASLESQLDLYRKALALKATNPGEATKIFQQLEATADESVKVRSKLQIGELLYSKNQYDLALQAFEDIITKHADSGVVIDALKYAAVCSDKLGNTPKRDQYTSMLNDVFEVK
jgi:tetratricopeptide (TPR) repeat protein